MNYNVFSDKIRNLYQTKSAEVSTKLLTLLYAELDKIQFSSSCHNLVFSIDWPTELHDNCLIKESIVDELTKLEYSFETIESIELRSDNGKIRFEISIYVDLYQ